MSSVVLEATQRAAEIQPAPQAAPRRRIALTPFSAGLAALAALTMIAGFALIYAIGFSAVQEHRAQAQRYSQLRGLLDPVSQTPPATGGVIAPGTPVALINAPAAHLSNLVVLEGTSPSDLLSGPGHLRDTMLPGQEGTSIVLGRSLTAGAPFHSIGELKSGDEIKVITGQGHFVYKVVDQRVGGSKMPTVPSGGSLLTFETSAGSSWLGPLTPTHVLYVDAILDGKSVPASGDHVFAVPSDELPGDSDPSAWVFVVLWLQALLVAGCAITWLALRWGRWQTWLVGTPVLIALLWGLSTEAMRLLPNLV